MPFDTSGGVHWGKLELLLVTPAFGVSYPREQHRNSDVVHELMRSNASLGRVICCAEDPLLLIARR